MPKEVKFHSDMPEYEDDDEDEEQHACPYEESGSYLNDALEICHNLLMLARNIREYNKELSVPDDTEIIQDTAACERHYVKLMKQITDTIAAEAIISAEVEQDKN